MFRLSREDVAISDSVYRSLNDLVAKITGNKVTGWEDHYDVILDPDGLVSAEPKNQSAGLLGFTRKLQQKLVVLPTPEWVRDSKQRRYICFSYELAGFMEKWWEEYAKLIR